MVIRVAFDRMDVSVSLYFEALQVSSSSSLRFFPFSVHDLSIYLSIYRDVCSNFDRRLAIFSFFKKEKDRRSKILIVHVQVEQGFILYRIGHSFLASSRDQCGRCQTFGTSRPPRSSIRFLLDLNPIVPIGCS